MSLWLLEFPLGRLGFWSARYVHEREGWERGDLTGEVFFSCLGWLVEGNGDGTDSTLPSIVVLELNFALVVVVLFLFL